MARIPSLCSRLLPRWTFYKGIYTIKECLSTFPVITNHSLRINSQKPSPQRRNQPSHSSTYQPARSRHVLCNPPDRRPPGHLLHPRAGRVHQYLWPPVPDRGPGHQDADAWLHLHDEVGKCHLHVARHQRMLRELERQAEWRHQVSYLRILPLSHPECERRVVAARITHPKSYR